MKYENETDRLLATKLNALRGRSKNGRGEVNFKPIPFGLTFTWLKKQWVLQKGRCFFTGAEMQLHTKGDGKPAFNAMSFDRVKQSKGYVRGNVVLCLHSVNLVKSDVAEYIHRKDTQKFATEIFGRKFVNRIKSVVKQSKKRKHIVPMRFR